MSEKIIVRVSTPTAEKVVVKVTEPAPQSGGGGGVPEAPQDGSPYQRQDAGWVPGDSPTAPRPPTSHALAGGDHSASTLAELNSKVSDATLDDAANPRPPSPHTHTLADVTDSGTAAARNVPAAGDAAAGECVLGNDSRLGGGGGGLQNWTEDGSGNLTPDGADQAIGSLANPVGEFSGQELSLKNGSSAQTHIFQADDDAIVLGSKTAPEAGGLVRVAGTTALGLDFVVSDTGQVTITAKDNGQNLTVNTGNLFTLTRRGSARLSIENNRNVFYRPLTPDFDGTQSLGEDGRQWGALYATQLGGKAIAAPANPATDKYAIYYDSTAKELRLKINNSGTTTTHAFQIGPPI